MRNYKKYGIWQRSHVIVLIIYKDITPCFPKSELFGLTSQMQRAAYSIPLNIAEGSGRNSEKDFAHFLDIALGSAQELEYCLLLAKDLAFIKEEQYSILDEMINGIKAMIITLIKKIRKNLL